MFNCIVLQQRSKHSFSCWSVHDFLTARVNFVLWLSFSMTVADYSCVCVREKARTWHCGSPTPLPRSWGLLLLQVSHLFMQPFPDTLLGKYPHVSQQGGVGNSGLVSPLHETEPKSQKSGWLAGFDAGLHPSISSALTLRLLQLCAVQGILRSLHLERRWQKMIQLPCNKKKTHGNKSFHSPKRK